MKDGNEVGFYSQSGKTWIEGDVTGDGVADIVIELTDSYKLKASDFVVGDPVLGQAAEWNADYPTFDYEAYHRDAFFLV